MVSREYQTWRILQQTRRLETLVMTPEALAAIRDREIVVLRIFGGDTGKNDVFLGGRATFCPGDTVATFFVSHPDSPSKHCLSMEGEKEGFEYIPTGKLLEECFESDLEFKNYWDYSVRALDIDHDSPAACYAYCSVALTLVQARHMGALDPAWFEEENGVPLHSIEDLHSLVAHVSEQLKAFCENYSEIEERVLN